MSIHAPKNQYGWPHFTQSLYRCESEIRCPECDSCGTIITLVKPTDMAPMRCVINGMTRADFNPETNQIEYTQTLPVDLAHNATLYCEECDCSFPHPAKSPYYEVAIYLHNRAYGGPEEGGWWYDTYERCMGTSALPAQPVSFTDYQKACVAKQCLEEWIDLAYPDNKDIDIGSVNSPGRYVALAFTGKAPPYLPRNTPHFE